MLDLWDSIKHVNICILEIPEGMVRIQGIENVFEEIMAKNFSNIKRKQISRYRKHRVSNRLTSRCIIIKMAKFKDKEDSNPGIEKQSVSYKGIA